MMGEFRGKRLFSGRLFAGLLFGPLEDQAEDEEDQTAFGPHRRRAWRPAPIASATPPKRPRRRRREEVLFLGV